MEHVWSVLCSSSSVDRDTNRLSLFEVVEGIHFFRLGNLHEETNIEVVPATVTIVSLIWRSNLDVEEEGTLRVQIFSPDNHIVELETIPTVKIDLTGTFRRYRARLGFQGIPYAGDGVYRFVVQLQSGNDEEWATVTRVPLEINMVENPNQKPVNELSPE